MATTALACTGDPLLDMLLSDCSSFSLLPVGCETVDEALRQVAEGRPGLLFVSPALGDLQRLSGLRGVRLCCLAEGGGETPAGLESLSASRLTADLIDGWVQQRGRPADERPAPVPTPSTSAPPAPPPRPKAGAIPPPPSLPRPAARPPATPPLSRPRADPPRPEPPRPVLSVLRQQVVTFWGGKPGSGRSTLAVALSDLLSRAGAIRVCTVDLNPQNSSLAPLVGKEQEVPSWFHLTEALGRGAPFPADALRWVRPNWAILSGPAGRPEWVGHLEPGAIAWMVDGLRSQFDYIILDPEARPGPISETALRLAQSLLLTVAPDYSDVLDTTRLFEAVLEAGLIDRGRCRLVLSRWFETPHLPASDVADCFGIPVSLQVPVAVEAVVGAASQGIPVTQLESPAARAFAQSLSPLVGLVAEAVATTGGGQGGLGTHLRGLFGR